MDINDKIRKSRIYSYIMSCIAVYWMSECLQWIYSLNLDTLTVQTSGLAIGVLGALVALVKMIFTFASHSPPPDKIE